MHLKQIGSCIPISLRASKFLEICRRHEFQVIQQNQNPCYLLRNLSGQWIEKILDRAFTFNRFIKDYCCCPQCHVNSHVNICHPGRKGLCFKGKLTWKKSKTILSGMLSPDTLQSDDSGNYGKKFFPLLRHRGCWKTRISSKLYRGRRVSWMLASHWNQKIHSGEQTANCE